MATKESLQEDGQQFNDAFAEDAPSAAGMSDDEAFGIALPEADEMPDDNSGNGEPAVSVDILPDEPAPEGEGGVAVADPAADPAAGEELPSAANDEQGELPLEGEGEGGEFDIEKEKQRLRSWEGRLKAQQAAMGDKGDEPGDGGDLDAAIAQLTEDFGEDFVKAVQTLAKSVAASEAGEKIGAINSTVEDLIADIADRRARRHFEDIHDAHPDFIEISESPEFSEWVAKLSGDEKATVERILAQGSAKEINGVLSQYKGATQGGDGIKGEADEFVLDDAEGVRSSGIRLPSEPAPANDDFLKAWNES